MSRIFKYSLAFAAAFALVAGPVCAIDKPAAPQSGADAKETSSISLTVTGMV